MKWQYKCFMCEEVHADKEQFTHFCPEYAVYKSVIDTKRRRFSRWFWKLDHTWFLATAGGLAVSAVFTIHFHYSLCESIVTGLGWGFLLGRIVRYGDY